MADFMTDLDDLVTRHRAQGADIGEISADLRSVADGLDEEEKDNET